MALDPLSGEVILSRKRTHGLKSVSFADLQVGAFPVLCVSVLGHISAQSNRDLIECAVEARRNDVGSVVIAFLFWLVGKGAIACQSCHTYEVRMLTSPQDQGAPKS